MGATDTGLRKQCRRWNEPWHAHYLTFSCYRRQPFFAGRWAAPWFAEALAAARQSERFGLWAWVIMPEHVHLIIAPGEHYSISRILWKIKKPFSDRVLRHVRQECPEFLPRMAEARPGGRVSHRFWQPGGGYDRNLRTVRDVYEKIRYVHENPVRRHLVERPEDWPWSSYRAWTKDVDEPISLDRDSLPPMME